MNLLKQSGILGIWLLAGFAIGYIGVSVVYYIAVGVAQLLQQIVG